MDVPAKDQYILFGDTHFPVREIALIEPILDRPRWYLVGTEGLQSQLLDDDGDYISEEAEYVDELIYYFIDDDELTLEQSILTSMVAKSTDTRPATSAEIREHLTS